jgi:hypothetical protein
VPYLRVRITTLRPTPIVALMKILDCQLLSRWLDYQLIGGPKSDTHKAINILSAGDWK